MAVDLRDNTNLKAACEAVLAHNRELPWYQNWLKKLSEFLRKVQDADQEEFCSPAFQELLWESEVITTTGMGTVNVSEVIADPRVAECLWNLRASLKTVDAHLHDQVLNEGWRELNQLVAPPAVRRNPRLKKYRLFAALCPTELTTLAHYPKLRTLASLIGVGGSERDLSLHQGVLERLNDVLGNREEGLSTPSLERMTLPWLLYMKFVQEQEAEATEIADPSTGQERLNPLPAERRRRGMLAIGGGIATIRAIIEFAKEGCKREDLVEHMRSINPSHATSSIRTQLNSLIAEWGVLRAQGEEIHLTPRGEGLLETGEPDEVSDWLLTRVLGVDHMLFALRNGPMSVSAMNEVLRKVNPGWTSDRALTSLTFWLRALQLVETRADKLQHLTELGETWAAQIYWEPQSLAPEAGSVAASLVPSSEEAAPFERPSLETILRSFPEDIAFPISLVARLDAGLWSHQRRHFAVLTGLSGAGKTVLARGYALALHEGQTHPAEGLLTVPVQPGWHDPSCLLGYVNPLNSESYVRTAFVDFLLRASADSERPYTVVLDEMNLSHPEQYLAPLLSAMETGDHIELHAQDNDISGVPATIMYPSNLVIIGTVNMDETTHGLSDKVLDRAAVIEFWDIDVEAFPGWKTSALAEEQVVRVRDTLKGLVKALRPARLHFGWRTIHDVIGYIEQAERGGVIDFDTALDQAIYAKVLPKLRGEDTPRVQAAFADTSTLLRDMRLADSAAKVAELQDDLRSMGSARFWR
ncbi:hypothetical protein JFT60_23165 [Pseudomonas sp. MF6772]|uniref:Restriction endonuclease n=1 Tax=Pseudomonas helleri TaxID=1608996 RepID=A0A7X1XIF4_9PSED|nr:MULTISPECIES: restriction endonuclease [Pseudomonas]KRA26240.1 restriction endonuclease [Pseudomonas sp. Root569]MBJ2270283.1 hypothetical protein [Pseudomonas sp. MF6772]MQT92117.1 restriction endonuclease [Pseudomonas helleri]NMX81888.1 restriction endonuclease [Pseudomonas sp. WS 5503]CAD0262002.1 conserved hypothetical protein [Pseudomonas veronii]